MVNIDLNPPLMCIYCFNDPQAPGAMSTARFVVNGQSVCIDHSSVARKYRFFGDARVEMLENANKHLRDVA